MSGFDALEEFPPLGVVYPRHLQLYSLRKTVNLGKSIMAAFSIPRPTVKGAPFKLPEGHIPSLGLLTADATIAVANRYCNVIGTEIFAFSLYNYQKSRGLEVPRQLLALAASFVSYSTT